MPSPLVVYPDTTLLLPPRFMGSVGYYAMMARYGRVVIDTDVRYDKRQKAVHRCDIVDVRGDVQLTVPLAKPSLEKGERPTWRHCRISTHDEWWRQMKVTLESAYGRTPYFEFLIDKFDCLFRSPEDWDEWPDAIVYDQVADGIVRGILAMDNIVDWAPASVAENAGNVVDMRRNDFIINNQPEYWQVRRERLGFRDNLSILDLVFNLGPEAAFYLKKISASDVTF